MRAGQPLIEGSIIDQPSKAGTLHAAVEQSAVEAAKVGQGGSSRPNKEILRFVSPIHLTIAPPIVWMLVSLASSHIAEVHRI